jgi:IS30 family transposase
VAPATCIDHRPAAVLDRVRCGGWEGDLILGAGNRSAIGTLVDRASRTCRSCTYQAATAPTLSETA